MSVDFNDANKAWAEKLGLTFPLLSDMRRQGSRAYEAIFDDPAMADDPQKVFLYLRSKRAWVVIDKKGIVRFAKTTSPKVFNVNDELLQVLRTLQ